MAVKDNWSEYWQNEGAGGEVFVNQSGDKHKALSAFWRAQFKDLGSENALIDLACGAGSVFSELNFPDSTELHAADISEVALKHLKQRMPNVKTHICSADKLPFASESYHVVVSQFGIEYAGQKAFMEAGRIVKKGGRLILLCHYKDGYIDSKNQLELAGARLVSSTGFIKSALEVTCALFSNDVDQIEQRVAEFKKVEPKLAEYCKSHPNGVHAHLYTGYRQLMNKVKAYTEADIVEWLNAMDEEVEKSIVRLTEMTNAALDSDQVVSLCQRLKDEHGFDVEIAEPFVLPEHSLPVAWQIRASKNS